MNPLLSNISNYSKFRNVRFVVSRDDGLLSGIESKKREEGFGDAKVIVLASRDTVLSDEFSALRNDKNNSFLVGVNSDEMSSDAYVRLTEMMNVALKLSMGFEVDFNAPHMTITKDNLYGVPIIMPHTKPANYEQLRILYEAQKFQKFA